MILFSGEDFNPVPHNPVIANYGNKDVSAPAVKVTKENIGKIALDLELDVRYTGGQVGVPFLIFWALRHDEDPIELTIYPGYWIVLIWGEIHIFRNDVFQHTFETTKPNWSVEQPEPIDEAEDIKKALERPPWIPNDAILYVEKETGKDVWLRPDVYNDLADNVKDLYELVEPNAETKIVSKVEVSEDAWGVQGNPIRTVPVEQARHELLSEDTQIIGKVGELNTDESNGTV